MTTEPIRLLRIRLKDKSSWPYRFSYSFERYEHKSCPPYGILSHVWGRDTDEVQYRHIVKETARYKKGYDKIAYCASWAYQDGLKYIWIDTCCIIKDDADPHRDEQHVMRHMFEWYKKAEKCYVYLKDVHWDDSHRSWQEFYDSEWHERGWTLQEMLAPQVVEFYDGDGDFIDDKTSLSRHLAKISNVPERAIKDASIVKEYSRAQRLRWADGRDCSRGRDFAYCVIGLCDVPMLPKKHETRAAAWQRLLDAIDEQEETSLNENMVKTGVAYGAIKLADWDVEESLEESKIGRKLLRAGVLRVTDRVQEDMLGSKCQLQRNLLKSSRKIARLCLDEGILRREEVRAIGNGRKIPSSPKAHDYIRAVLW